MRPATVATLALSVVLAVMLAPIVAPAALAQGAVVQGVAVTISVIGADGSPVAGATVTLIDASGNTYSNKTDSNGVAVVNVPGGVYLIVVAAPSYYILSSINTSATTSVTVNASAMKYVNISSVPASVDFTIGLTAVGINATLSTNTTVYAPSTVAISFPSEVVRFPYRYTFDHLVYDSTTSNSTSVTLDMSANRAVTAYYAQSFYVPLPTWAVVVLIVLVVIAVFAAFRSASATAKHIIESQTKRFVRKKVHY